MMIILVFFGMYFNSISIRESCDKEKWKARCLNLDLGVWRWFYFNVHIKRKFFTQAALDTCLFSFLSALYCLHSLFARYFLLLFINLLPCSCTLYPHFLPKDAFYHIMEFFCYWKYRHNARTTPQFASPITPSVAYHCLRNANAIHNKRTCQ